MHEIDISEDTWNRMIEECDIDGDGKIDFEEFKRCMTESLNAKTRKNTVRERK